MFELIALAIFAGLLLAAAASDVATMKIPNWVSIALAAAYPVTALLNATPLIEIGAHLAFGLAILVAVYFAFQFNIFGGGDAKLIAACAVWTGYQHFAPFMLWMVLAGGVIALFLLVARKFAKPDEARPAFLNRLLKPRGGVPYGVAIAFGGVVALDVFSIALGAQLTTP